MMVDTATMPISSIPDTRNGTLILRCCGPTRVGQIVRLKSDKCTIGSDQACTLRLRARGVKPLHCLILRGRAETVIRRWAPDTRLNGRTFSDATLLPGDRISIGPIEFEVLDPSVQPFDESVGSTTVSESPPVEQGDAPRQLRHVQRLAERLRLSNRQGRARVRRLIKHLRQARTEISRRQDSGSVATKQAETGELEKKLQTLEEVQGRWEDAWAEAEERLRERAGQLDHRMAELEAERAKLRRQQSVWEASRSEAEKQLAARSKQIDTREADLDVRLAAASSELSPAGPSSPQPPPEAKHQAPSAEPLSDAVFPPRSNELQPDGPPAATPATSEDIFRRLATGMPVPAAGKSRFKAEYDSGSELVANPPSRSGQQVLDEHIAGQPPEAPDTADDNEESVDQYMARLLTRIRGEGDGESSPTPSQGRPDQAGSAESRKSATPAHAPPRSALPSAGDMGQNAVPQVAGNKSGQTNAEDGKDQQCGSIEMLPKTHASQRPVNLTAMRELANASAQTAIHRHQRGRILRTGYTKLAVAFLGLFGGVALLWIWSSGTHNPLALAAAIVGFGAAAFFAIWYALLAGQLLFSASDYPGAESQTEQNAVLSEEMEPARVGACTHAER